MIAKFNLIEESYTKGTNNFRSFKISQKERYKMKKITGKFPTTLTFIALIVFFAFLASCGGNGGGGGDDDDDDTSTAPTISDVEIYKCDDAAKTNSVESNTLSNGGFYYHRVSYTDPDLDLLNLSRSILSPNNYNEYSIIDGPEIFDISPQGTASGISENDQAEQSNFGPGEYRFDYQMEDADGNLSNTFEVMITVE